MLREAVGGSASAPTYFDPMTYIDQYGTKERLIDGGVIANNPALYAYFVAKRLKHKEDIRVISLGTAGKPFQPIESAEEINLASYLTSVDDFMMRIDIRSAHFSLDWCDELTDYLRLNTISYAKMDDVSPENIQTLVEDGEKLWEEEKANV